MKPTAICTFERLIAWDSFEVTALHDDSYESLDDRLHERLPDSDQDERDLVEIILQQAEHNLN
jgi:hypothetical protein